MARIYSLMLAALIALQTGAAVAQPMGPEPAGVTVFDKIMSDSLTNYAIPGGTLAITFNGRLVLARGYGLQDVESNIPTQPDTAFRLASLSKQITAVSILKLVEQGKLNLDDSAFSYLPDLQPLPGKTLDPRTSSITIRHLLEHAGGYDRDVDLDPMFNAAAIAKDLGVESPPSTTDIIRWMLGRPLIFAPGSKSVYSNFGYAVLGRIIERITHTPYDICVRANILGPVGAAQVRTGNTLAFGKLPNETKYYNGGTGPSVFPLTPPMLPWSYGGWYIEAMDSHGGWVSSAINLLRFWNAIEGRRGTALLSPNSIAGMVANPGIPDNTPSEWYGFGFGVQPDPPAGAYWFHSGYLDGQTTYVVRSPRGWDYAAFFNASPSQQQAKELTGKSTPFLTQLDTKMAVALNSMTWPANVDYFPMFPTASATQPMTQGQNGVVNGASYLRGVTPGSWVTIFGANLAGTTRIWGAADFAGQSLPLILDGVSVTINGKPAAVYYVSPTQINVQAPADSTAGWVPVEVFYNGISAGVVGGEIRQVRPELFTYGAKHYAAARFGADPNTVAGDPAVTPGTKAAKPGDVLTLYATGLAASPAGTIINSPAALGTLPTVKIGGVTAPVSYAGLVAAGEFQINLTVPNVGPGDQPITIAMGATASQGSAVLTIGK